MATGGSGTFVLAWEQTVIDGRLNAPQDALRAGSVWAFEGHPLRIDGPVGVLPLPGQPDSLIRQARVGHDLRRRLRLRPVAAELAPPDPTDSPDGGPDGGFSLTDGRRLWLARFVLRAPDRPPLILFDGPPPQAETLWVVARLAARERPVGPGPVAVPAGVVQGTRVTYADGHSRPVETLVAGDQLRLADGGLCDVLWTARQSFSGARLQAMPALQPLRLRPGGMGPGTPRTGLVLSPGQQILLTGAEALFSCESVLVMAEDLDGPGWLTRDRGATDLTVHHLVLSRPGLIMAEGVAMAAQAPAAADLPRLSPDDRAALQLALSRVGAATTPSPRVLTRSEAALFAWPMHWAA